MYFRDEGALMPEHAGFSDRVYQWSPRRNWLAYRLNEVTRRRILYARSSKAGLLIKKSILSSALDFSCCFVWITLYIFPVNIFARPENKRRKRDCLPMRAWRGTILFRFFSFFVFLSLFLYVYVHIIQQRDVTLLRGNILVARCLLSYICVYKVSRLRKSFPSRFTWEILSFILTIIISRSISKMIRLRHIRSMHIWTSIVNIGIQ